MRALPIATAAIVAACLPGGEVDVIATDVDIGQATRITPGHPLRTNRPRWGVCAVLPLGYAVDVRQKRVRDAHGAEIVLSASLTTESGEVVPLDAMASQGNANTVCWSPAKYPESANTFVLLEIQSSAPWTSSKVYWRSADK